MSNQDSAYFLALSSSVLFSGASVIFARFSASHSSLWMNFMKNTVAGCAFCVTALLMLMAGEGHGGSFISLALLLVSGFISLAVGDFFLFSAYKKIGSARAIMVFSLSPLFLTIEGFLFFGQGLASFQFLAILLMMACVWTISYEKFRQKGHWEWGGILFAIAGVLLDNIGIVLSRKAFDLSPGLGSMQANAIRSIGAVVPIYFVFLYKKERPFSVFYHLPWKDRGLVLFSSLMGTFLSLYCWMLALKVGHIGSLAGVGSFNPVAASLWEWILLRKRPTVYLLAALVLFLSGFFLLLHGGRV